jgi:hypothetical protein
MMLLEVFKKLYFERLYERKKGSESEKLYMHSLKETRTLVCEDDFWSETGHHLRPGLFSK